MRGFQICFMQQDGAYLLLNNDGGKVIVDVLLNSSGLFIFVDQNEDVHCCCVARTWSCSWYVIF